MDPLSAIGTVTSLIGFGMSLFGGSSAADDARQAAQIQSNIAGDEGKLEDQRHTAMELAASRQQMEVLRNNQRARATAINNATNQGANLGSGLAGGLSQIQDASAFSLAGINQNLEIGENMFGINKDITSQKQQLAQVQGQMATDQGIASLGGAITKIGPTFGNIAQSAFGGGSSGIRLGSPSGPGVFS